MIDLDSHTNTFPCASSLEWMKPYLEPHKMSLEFLSQLEHRAFHIYDLVGADLTDNFVFTSSGAEAVNQVLWSVFLEVSRKEGKTHFIASAIEDAPTMQMLKRLEDLGCTVKIAPVDSSGKIDLKKLEELISPRTALITATMAEGLTGVIQPFEEIAKLAAEKKVLLHLDAAYAVGKLTFSFTDLGVDYLTFSGDRIHSVKGGALFAKKDRPVAPLILGGGTLRGGSFDIASFMALSAASSQAELTLDGMSLEVARLRDLLEKEVVKRVPGAHPIFENELRLPNTSTILFPKVHQEALLYFLHQKGLKVSIGGGYSQHLHRLLMASGVNEDKALTAVSFSLSRMTTEEEIFRAVTIIEEATASLHKISEDLF